MMGGVSLWHIRRKRSVRVHSSKAHDVFRGLRVVGAGAAVVAGVLTGIGAAAEVGATHPDKLWIFLPGAFLVMSVACAVVGTIGTYLTRRVSDAHATILRDTALLLIESLSHGNLSNYAANGHQPREAFRAHYPALAARLDEWDDLRGRQLAAEQALRDRVRALAEEHSLGSPPYETSAITSYVQNLVDRDLREGNTSSWGTLSWVGFSSGSTTPGPPTGVLTPVHNQTWIALPPRADEADKEWSERARAAHEPVDAYFAVAQTLPEFDTAAELVLRVREFREREIIQIIENLKHVQEMEPPARRRRCPTRLAPFDESSGCFRWSTPTAHPADDYGGREDTSSVEAVREADRRSSASTRDRPCEDHDGRQTARAVERG